MKNTIKILVASTALFAVTLGTASTLNAATAQQSGANLQTLLDEREIIRVVDDIGVAVDQKDWTRVGTHFTEKVRVDFSSLGGGQPAEINSTDLVAAWKRNLFADKRSLHMHGNHRVTIQGNQASIYLHGYAYNHLMSRTGSDLWETWGNYQHSLTRTPQGWKVTSFTFNMTYSRGNERARDFVPAN